MKAYHGSRNETLSFYPAICFTDSESSASAYGPHMHCVEIDMSALSVLHVRMSDDELREAIDNQDWPCDTAIQIAQTIADGHNAVRYMDVDANGNTHDCVRILTSEAFAAAVSAS